MSTSASHELPIHRVEKKKEEEEEEVEEPAEDALRYLVDDMMQRRGFEELAFKNLKLEEKDADAQLVRYSLEVTDELTDAAGALHSGMFGALADLTGSSILHQLMHNSGSVINMKLAFSSSARAGSKVVVEVLAGLNLLNLC